MAALASIGWAVVAWWLALSLLGWLAWPLAAILCRSLPGRGYAYARSLGLLALGYLYWAAGMCGLPQSPAVLWGALALAAAGGLWGLISQRRTLAAFLGREWRQVLVAELLFAAVLLLYALHKAYDPAIDHTEEPMDFAMLNGILRSPGLPPRDPWLTGHPISYYYLGYYLVSVMARLAALPAGVAYNLGLAQALALTVLGAYGLLTDALRMGRRDQRSGTATVTLAAAGALTLGLAGNGVGPFEVLRALGLRAPSFYAWLGVPGLAEAPVTGGLVPAGRWWWWRASRVMLDLNYLGRTATVITEFPAFSFLLGDLHPHVMALPYTLLALGLAAQLYAQEREASAAPWQRPVRWLLMGWIIGALGFLNSWDLPTHALAAVLAYALGCWRGPAGWRHWVFNILVASALLDVGALAPYLPFYAGLRSQAQGVGLAYYTKTPLRSYLLCFGLWLLPLAADLAPELWRRLVGPRSLRRAFLTTWLALLVAPWCLTLAVGGLGRLLLGLGTLIVRGPWLLLVQSAALAALWLNLRDDLATPADHVSADRMLGHLFALLGVGLTYAVEFVFLRDLFGTRMNTVFKLYYQAWTLLGLAAVLAMARLWRRGLGGRLALGASALLMGAGLAYTGVAAHTRAEGYQGAPTLDGTVYLDEEDPDAAGALRWLRANAGPQDVLLEAPGEEYDATTNRLSAWTGIPTVLGWPGHEEQWRGDDGEVLRRQQDIAAIYTLADEAQTLDLLGTYGITWVLIGPYERDKYALDEAQLARWRALLPVRYESGEVWLLSTGP